MTKKERQEKLAVAHESEIVSTINVYEEKIKKLENKISELKEDMFKYHVGNLVIDKKYLFIWKVLKISLVKGVKTYLVHPQTMSEYVDTNWRTNAEAYRTNADLTEDEILCLYDKTTYTSILFNELQELKDKIAGGYETY